MSEEAVANEMVECEKCCGKGTVSVEIACKKCEGEGYLDWIENVIGKQKPLYPDFQFASLGPNTTTTALEISSGGDIKIGDKYVFGTIDEFSERLEELEKTVERLKQEKSEKGTK